MKKLLIVLVLMGCSANYIIPDGKTQRDLDQTKVECEQLTGQKINGFALGNPVFVAAVIGVGAGWNVYIEKKFRDCMFERGYNVEE